MKIVKILPKNDTSVCGIVCLRSSLSKTVEPFFATARHFILRLALGTCPKRLLTNDGGNVSVATALCIMAIVFFAALAIDLGFLTMEKDHLQNKTEAAVKSGVHVLHKDPSHIEPLYRMMDSYHANGEDIPLMLLFSRYHPGFYDYRDEYGDFGHYKKFASLRYGEIPDGESLNAVAVIDLKKYIDTVEIKPEGSNRGRVGVSAVAYSKNYTFLSLSDEAQAMDWSGWADGYCRYENCLIGSNGNIDFNGTETFDSKTIVEAGGSVTGADSARIKKSANINVPVIDWNKLRQDANSNGKVYDPESWATNWQQDEFGNWFCRGYFYRAARPPNWSNPNGSPAVKRVRYFFTPHAENLDAPDGISGDHKGRTYFFEMPDPAETPEGANESILYFLVKSDESVIRRRFWNCTFAGTGSMSTFPCQQAPAQYRYVHFGNYENIPDDSGLVYFYCRDFGDPFDGQSFDRACWYTSYGGSANAAEPHGVIIRTEGDFRMYSQLTVPTKFYLKVIASKMYLYSPSWRRSSITFVGGFGTPDIYKLGVLKESK